MYIHHVAFHVPVHWFSLVPPKHMVLVSTMIKYKKPDGWSIWRVLSGSDHLVQPISWFAITHQGLWFYHILSLQSHHMSVMSPRITDDQAIHIFVVFSNAIGQNITATIVRFRRVRNDVNMNSNCVSIHEGMIYVTPIDGSSVDVHVE